MDMHINIVCPSYLQSFRKFCWAASEKLRWQTDSVVSVILIKFLSSRRASFRPKKWIKISCGYAHLHDMFFITTKFQEILLNGFREVALTNCFSSIFHFGQISKLKKGVILRKKIESTFPVYMHIYTLCPSLLQSFRKFCWVLSEDLYWQTVSVASLILV